MSSKAAVISGGEIAMVPKLRFPEFRAAGVWKPISLKNASTPVIEQVGQRMLTPVSISAGIGFVRQSEKFGRDISGNQYQLYTLVRDGDFVFNKGNSLKFPQGCIYLLDGWGEVAAPNVFICFRLKDGYSNAFFQNCFEQNQHGRQLQKDITSGARSNGLLNISKETFFGVEILTPSLSEQQKIADCLTSADELITAQTEKVEALKAHKKGLMQQLFPRPERTENGKKVPPETNPRLRFPEFEGTGDWEYEELAKFIEEFREKSTVQDEFEVMTSARSGLVRQRDYYDNDRITERDNIGFNVIPPNYLTYRSRSDDRRFYFNENNSGIKGIVSVYYPVFRFVKGSNKFLIELLSSFAQIVGKYSVGTSQTVLSLNQLKRISLPTPIKEEQNRIADCLTSLDDLIAAQSQKLDALKAHKKGLMQQLFSSHRDVEA
jgi:type I restriction enzyme S subunit